MNPLFRHRACLLAFALFLLLPAGSRATMDRLPAYVPGELLVKYSDRAPAALPELTTRLGMSVLRRFHGMPLVHVRLPAGADVLEMAAYLRKQPGVEYAEPNYRRFAAAVPNDPYFGLQWALENSGQSVNGTAGAGDADIDAAEAWNRTTAGVTVAVIDTGVQYAHPDLAANIWTNTGEIAGNGLDDDGNGYVDDVRGWDFGDNDNDPDDPDGHGTAAAGVLGAAGNNGTGGAGVAWNVRIMPLKFLSGAGVQTVSDEIAAIQYARMMGARVINCSFGGAGYSQAERDAIAATTGAVFVASAGNSAQNSDQFPEYPASYAEANIIAVAASTQSDDLAWFSNFGAATVHVAAPGVDILTTLPGGYGYFTGTSASAPVVSGIASLMLALNPNLAPSTIVALIKGTVDSKAAFAGILTTGGRVNAASALAAVAQANSSSGTNGGDAGGGGGGGCFIATAAHGSALAPQVIVLSRFRDQYLLKNRPGRAFVRAYYHFSPPLAAAIARHEPLKFAARIILLPAIAIGALILFLGPFPVLGMCILFWTGLSWRRQWRRARDGAFG